MDILNSIGNITLAYDNATGTVYELAALDDSDNLKRGRPLSCGSTYYEHQLAKQGIWWSPWYKIGSCVYNQKSSGEAEMAINWLCTYTWTIHAGPIGWGVVESLIGSSWSKSVSKGGQLTCHIPAGLKGSVWYQTQVKWGEVQRRVKNYCITGAWSQYYHFDAPSKYNPGGGRTNLGCSTGSASECP